MSIGKWNDRYQAGEQVFKSPAPLVIEFAGPLAPGSALDLASGPGRNALYLAERGWRVTALDGSPVAIDLLRHRAREQNLSVETKVIDLEAQRVRRAPPDGSGIASRRTPFCASSIRSAQAAERGAKRVKEELPGSRRRGESVVRGFLRRKPANSKFPPSPSILFSPAITSSAV